MSKQDRQGVRLPADVERKWNFKRRFDSAMGAAAEAKEEVEKLDEAMTQTEIFNRLTNYGKAQGFFMDEDGQLYVNASYLVTGILKSQDNKTFYLDLVKGVLRGHFEEFSIGGKSVEEIATDASNKAQKYADQAAKDAVNAQTQSDVFNKLTNNGTAQGIYYRNGQLYINASYLVAGILQTLDSSTFYLDLANNVLKILGKTVSWEQQDDGKFYLVGK
jgi:hypothetical protein